MPLMSQLAVLEAPQAVVLQQLALPHWQCGMMHRAGSLHAQHALSDGLTHLNKHTVCSGLLQVPQLFGPTANIEVAPQVHHFSQKNAGKGLALFTLAIACPAGLGLKHVIFNGRLIRPTKGPGTMRKALTDTKGSGSWPATPCVAFQTPVKELAVNTRVNKELFTDAVDSHKSGAVLAIRARDTLLL